MIFCQILLLKLAQRTSMSPGCKQIGKTLSHREQRGKIIEFVTSVSLGVHSKINEPNGMEEAFLPLRWASPLVHLSGKGLWSEGGNPLWRIDLRLPPKLPARLSKPAGIGRTAGTS